MEMEKEIKLAEQLKQLRAENLALREAADISLEHKEFKKAAKAIFDSCKNLIGASSGYIALLSKDGHENEVLFLDTGGATCNADPSLPMPIRGLRAEVFKTNKPLYDNNFLNSKYINFIPKCHVSLENVLFAPIIIEGKAVGLLGLANKKGGFTENDALIALSFGEITASALIKSRITELMQRNEDRYKTIINTSMDGFWLTDTKGKFLETNDAYLKLIGYSRDELLNMNIGDVEVTENPEDTALHIKKVIKIGYDRFETKHKCKNGNIIDIEISVNYLNFQDGLLFVFLRDITDKNQNENLKSILEVMQKTIDNTVNVVTHITENRDPYTAGHQQRVTQLSCAIAKELGFDEERLKTLKFAAILHDIGKMYIPIEILSKPGKITDIEFSLIKSHPLASYEILKTIEFSGPVQDIIIQHHERENGSGYPKGLIGSNIMLEAKIIAVADVVEAMSSHRPYRPSLGIEKALEEIESNKIILYDFVVVDACIRIINEKGFKFRLQRLPPWT